MVAEREEHRRRGLTLRERHRDEVFGLCEEYGLDKVPLAELELLLKRWREERRGGNARSSPAAPNPLPAAA